MSSPFELYDLVERYKKDASPELLMQIGRQMHIPVQSPDELWKPENPHIYYDESWPRLRDEWDFHSHDFFEIIYVTESDDVQYFIGSDRYLLRKGDCLVIPPGVLHAPTFQGFEKSSYERFVLWISPAFLAKEKKVFPDIDAPLRHCQRENVRLLRMDAVESTQQFSLFCSLLRERQQRKRGWEDASACYVSLLLLLLNRGLVEKTTVMRAERADLFNRAFHYVNDHMMERLSVRSVADHLHVSTSTIARLFQENINMSLYHYITRVRLLRAKDLMAGELSLQEIGEHCGFTDYSSFYRSFKKEFGVSPSQFLRQKGPGSKAAVDDEN